MTTEAQTSFSYATEGGCIVAAVGGLLVAVGISNGLWPLAVLGAAGVPLGLWIAQRSAPRSSTRRRLLWVAVYLVLLAMGIGVGVAAGGLFLYVAAIVVGLGAPFVASGLTPEDVSDA